MNILIKYGKLIAALSLLFVIFHYAIPAIYHSMPAEMTNTIKARDLDPTALFYTESDQSDEAYQHFEQIRQFSVGSSQ